MSDIQQNLAKILSSRYGRDVRQSIHDGIHNCYEDGKAGSVDLVARELIQQKMSGSPAGTYANLAALIAANPDHSKIYLTLDDGKWCYWNGSAFVAGGVYQAASVAAQLAEIENRFVLGKNKFLGAWEQGAIASDGSFIAGGNYIRTNKFNIDPETTYTISYVRNPGGTSNTYIMPYDQNDAKLTTIGHFTANPYTFTTPAGCAKIALMQYTTTGITPQNAPANVQIELGSSATGYEPPTVVLAGMNAAIDAAIAPVSSQLAENAPVSLWEMGNIDNTTGNNAVPTTASRMRLKNMHPVSSLSSVTVGAGYFFVTFFYDEAGGYIGHKSYITSITKKYIEDNYPTAVYFRLTFRSNPEAAIEFSALANLNVVMSALYLKELGIIDRAESMIYTPTTIEWEVGTIDSAGGFNVNASTRIRSIGYIEIEEIYRISLNNLGGIFILFYDETHSYLGTSGKITRKNTFSTQDLLTYYDGAVYLRIILTDEQEASIGLVDTFEFVALTYAALKIANAKIKTLQDRIDEITPASETIFAPRDELILEGRVSWWEDFTCMGEYIMAATRSDGVDNEYGTNGSIIIIDKFGQVEKTLKHDFGHCNTIDYCEEVDSLIFGNGSGYYNLDGYIYIIQGVRHWLDFPNGYQLLLDGIDGSTVTTIPVFRDFGDKVNVVWGERNNGRNDICYVMSNDNQNIRKLLLGRGSTELENGVFIVGRSINEYNGTYVILDEWTADRLDVNQGTCYYNGHIYGNIGHSGSWLAKYSLNSDGTASVLQKREFLYDEYGDIISYAEGGGSGNGVFIKDGFIYHSTIEGMNYVKKFPVF